MVHCGVAPRRVLIIDDDRDTRTILDLMLSYRGYAVSTACDGYQGLMAARRERPDVILLDLAMPVLDGFEFRERQLQDPALAKIPVICVSGRHDARHVAKQMRIKHCVPKPFDLEVLLTKVAKVAR